MANPAVANLGRLNAVHMTATKMYVHAFPLSLVAEDGLQALLKKFGEQRQLRRAQNDLLRNGGNFIIDTVRGLLITGCDLSASIMRSLLGVAPKQVLHSIVWMFQTFKETPKGVFLFAKNLKII